MANLLWEQKTVIYLYPKSSGVSPTSILACTLLVTIGHDQSNCALDSMYDKTPYNTFKIMGLYN